MTAVRDPMDLLDDDDDFNPSQEFFEQVDEMASQYYEAAPPKRPRLDGGTAASSHLPGAALANGGASFRAELLAKEGEIKLLREEARKLREEVKAREKALAYEKAAKLRQMEDFSNQNRLAETKHKEEVDRLKGQLGFQEHMKQTLHDQARRMANASPRSAIQAERSTRKTLASVAVQADCAAKKTRIAHAAVFHVGLPLETSTWRQPGPVAPPFPSSRPCWEPSRLSHVTCSDIPGLRAFPESLAADLTRALGLLLQSSTDPRRFGQPDTALKLDDASDAVRVLSDRTADGTGAGLWRGVMVKCVKLALAALRLSKFESACVQLAEASVSMFLANCDCVPQNLIDGILKLATALIHSKTLDLETRMRGFSMLQALVLSPGCHVTCCDVNQAKRLGPSIYRRNLLDAAPGLPFLRWSSLLLDLIWAGLSGHDKARCGDPEDHGGGEGGSELSERGRSSLCSVTIRAAVFSLGFFNAFFALFSLHDCPDSALDEVADVAQKCVRVLEVISAGRELVRCDPRLSRSVAALQLTATELRLGRGNEVALTSVAGFIAEEDSPFED